MASVKLNNINKRMKRALIKTRSADRFTFILDSIPSHCRRSSVALSFVWSV
jgi:hypothetical protein